MTEEEEDLLQYVRGVDYKSVFSRINIALCVLRIDGRLIDCNHEFMRVSGLTNEELYKAGLKKNLNHLDDISPETRNEFGKVPLSLFNLIAREDMQTIFEAMSDMLTCHTQEGSAVNVKKEEETVTQEQQQHQQHQTLTTAAGTTTMSKNSDHWAGYIKRCHTSNCLQLNISLVRKKEGTPCFFNCALLPLTE
jgi:PAS domain-containing protein